jgi:hypothetical protein
VIKNLYSNNGYEFFDIRFKSKTDLIDYLSSAPTADVFKYDRLSSTEGSFEFTKTNSYEEALNFFKNGWYDGFNNFLTIKRQIDKFFPYISRKKMYHNSVNGSVPNVFNAVNNLPLTMRKNYKTDSFNRNIKIYVSSSYSWMTDENKIYNQGVLSLCLIDFLESLGFNVDLCFFEIAENGNQILYIENTLKKAGEKINLPKVYFPFCNPSYLRRLLFRVLETTNGLTKYWMNGYGSVCQENKIRELLNIDENSILIIDPQMMGIEGKNMINDTISFLTKININKYLAIDTQKYNIEDPHKILSKK